MTFTYCLDGMIELLDICYRSRAKFDPSKFKLIAVNNSDGIVQNSTMMQLLKLELTGADGYSRKPWAPTGQGIKDLIANTVDFAPVIVDFTKPVTPVVTLQWDGFVLIADASAVANRAIASISSNAFQSVAHGLAAGDRVFFDGATTYPGITADTYYWVSATSLTANQFRIAATSGGTAIALTTFTGLLTARCANGVVIGYEKVPTDGEGNNTRNFEPGETISATVQQGFS